MASCCRSAAFSTARCTQPWKPRDERAEQREEGANHARRLGQPDDTGKPQFFCDINMFGVVASHK